MDDGGRLRIALRPLGQYPHNNPMPTDFLSLFAMLEAAGVRYVVVGGLAVLLHGVDRITADVDLVVDLAPEEATRVVNVLVNAGMRPALPVDVSQFADPEIRQSWRRQQGMQVLSFWDPENRRPTVDLFTESPMDFERLWSQAEAMTISGFRIRVASVAHLVEIKLQAGRSRDLEDVARLEQLVRERGGT